MHREQIAVARRSKMGYCARYCCREPHISCAGGDQEPLFYMRHQAKISVGAFARLMAAGWLFQALLPTLCCWCCVAGETANAYGNAEVPYHPASCCCQTLFRQSKAGDQGAASRVAEERRTCATCESFGCFHGSDSRQSTLRRRQHEDTEGPIAKLVLLSHDISSDRDSHWPSPTWADACDQGAALSAAERCVSLQRLLL